MWIWVIAGIILSLIILLPESHNKSSTDIEIGASAEISFIDELDDWDIEDHIEELEDEIILYYDEEEEGLLNE